MLGLGLGSGEVVLWPYMTSNYGLGIVWGMVIGITMQFFINMEVSRYALINGESVFVGFARLVKWLPLWFIASTFFGFGWPGIGLFGASLLSATLQPLVDIDRGVLAVILFMGIGLTLSLGKLLYQTVERLQKILISVCVPLLVGITFYLTSRTDLLELMKGIGGQGVLNGIPYAFFPPDVIMGTFLGALAYAGAGGNLNLTQSCYVRDKGYGMGAHAKKIQSLFTGDHTDDPVQLSGNTFAINPQSLKTFAEWWRVINWEHFLVFWLLGLCTMLTLSLLAYTTTFGSTENISGINFILHEATSIGRQIKPFFGTLFLLICGLMLCATQLTVLDSTTRIISENVFLSYRKQHNLHISKIYYAVLWAQILFGASIVLLGFDQPLTLIILGAVINAFSMFVYTGLLTWLNNGILAKPLRPSLGRNLMMIFTFLFFGVFCAITAYTYT